MNEKSDYGFYSHLKKEFPSQIIIDITEKCNLACIHCPHESFSKSSIYSGAHLDPLLNKKLIDEVKSDEGGFCKFIRYTSDGEPLLHPKALEIFEYACKNSGIPVNLTTNGILLNEYKSRKILDSGINVIDISIDAFFPETYAIVRKKGDLNITRGNALRLIELIKKNNYTTKLVVSFVEQEKNTKETNLFENFWKNAGADYVVIRKLHSCSGAISEIAEKMYSTIPRRLPCLYPWERLVLKPNGYLCFCPTDWKYEAMISHFSNITIREAWVGEYMGSLRKAHLNNEFSEHKFCGKCPDWQVIPWPSKGRSYSVMMQEFSTNDNSINNEI